MNNARRAFDVLRGYVNNGWDSLTAHEESQAHKELKEAVEQPIRSVSVDRQAEPAPKPEPDIDLAAARTLFNIDETATTKQIEEAYVYLKDTIDPAKFPEGTPARDRAAKLQRRFVVARQVLLDNLDPTVRRFEALEIE